MCHQYKNIGKNSFICCNWLFFSCIYIYRYFCFLFLDFYSLFVSFAFSCSTANLNIFGWILHSIYNKCTMLTQNAHVHAHYEEFVFYNGNTFRRKILNSFCEGKKKNEKKLKLNVSCSWKSSKIVSVWMFPLSPKRIITFRHYT